MTFTNKIILFSAVILLMAGGCKKTCTDMRSLSYSLDTGSANPKNDSSQCYFSAAVWYILPADTIGIDFPLTIKIDGEKVGELSSSAAIAANICDTEMLPAAQYVVSKLNDGRVHYWAAYSPGDHVKDMDSIRASALNPCLSVKIGQ